MLSIVKFDTNHFPLNTLVKQEEILKHTPMKMKTILSSPNEPVT